jgi:predicted ATPase
MSPTAVTPNNFATFGELLKYLRRQARLTQNELALAVGYSNAQVSRMEKNQRTPDEATIQALIVPALGIERNTQWVERLLDLARAVQAQIALESPAPTKDGENTAVPNNLPLQLTSYIGRQKEIEELIQLFGTHRLVTIIGAGGMGKTRLSLQLAKDLAKDYPQGTWLIELASINDPAFVPFSLAHGVGMQEQEGPEHAITEKIVGYFHPRKVLLLLDNCEHLIESVARLAEIILKECPQVSIVATSREALGVKGEAVYRLSPLEIPAEKSEPENIMQSESVRLFMERARDAAPSLKVAPEEAPTIARICQRLDGIPLSIELAAVRVKMMTLEEIAERLDNRFNVLTGGARTSLPRQQTLRASIEWSYDLLSDEEKKVFSRLSVFMHGWTLFAMEAVCADDKITSSGILDLAARLVDKSLILADFHAGETRYHMLETIRQYAVEKIMEAGEDVQIRNKHLEYYMNLAETAEPNLQSGEQAYWFARLENEKDNLRAALGWALRTDQIESGLRLAGALFAFWFNKGYWSEGYARVSALLESKKESQSLARAKALVTAGSLASSCGLADEMNPYFEEGIQLLRKQGEEGRQLLGFAISEYSRAFIDRDLERGLALAEEAIRTSRESRDAVSQAYSLWGIGMITRRLSDFKAAQAAQEESMELFKKMGNRRYYALLMSNLAYTHYYHGKLEQARDTFDLSMALAREIGDGYSEANSIPGRGDIDRRFGKFDEAERLLRRGLAYHRDIGESHQGLVNELNSLGLLELSRGNRVRAHQYLLEGAQAAERGNIRFFLRFLLDSLGFAASEKAPTQAAQFFGAAEGLREQLGTKLFPIELEEYHQYLTLAQAQLDSEDWQSAWKQGKAMSLEKIIEQAEEQL